MPLSKKLPPASPTYAPKRILRIVPIVPLPRARSPFFSYRSNEEISIGSLVSIPFGPQTVRGIVWDEEPSTTQTSHQKKFPAFRCKFVQKILAPALLSDRERRLAEFLSEKYFTALGNSVELFLPKYLPSAQDVSENAQPLPFLKESTPTLSKEQRSVARKIFKSASPSLLFAPAGSGKTYVHFELIRACLTHGGQALIIVPHHTILIQEFRRYASVFGADALAIFHPHLKKTALSTAQTAIRDGSAHIILGTRQSLFLGFHRLRVVILDDADADSYKQKDIAPFYQTETVAKKLATLHDAHFLASTSAPTFRLYFLAQRHQSLFTLPARSPARKWHIINLRLEHWKKKRAPISDELAQAILSTAKNNQQSILFVHKSGMSAFSICAECRQVLRCVSCGKPVEYQRNGEYHCKRCHISAGATPSCITCGALEFKHFGIGTERIERDLHRRFPSLRITRLDTKNEKLTRTTSALEQFLNGTIDVLITTKIGIHGWDLPRVSTIGIIDADTLLGIPTWNSDEQAFRSLLSVGTRGQQSATVFMQTFHPENPLFASLIQENIVSFFETKSEERETFFYPPFGSIFRLVGRCTDEKKLNRNAQKIFSELEQLARASTKKTRLTPPVSPKQSRFAGYAEIHITLREAFSNKEIKKGKPFQTIFEPILRTLSHEWSIDSEFF